MINFDVKPAVRHATGLIDATTIRRTPRRDLTDWRSVAPPNADRRVVDAIIDGYTRVAEKMDDMRRYIEGGDIARAQAASDDADELAKEPRANGRDYGFRMCVD